MFALNEAPHTEDTQEGDANWRRAATPHYKKPTDKIYHKIYNLHEELERRIYTLLLK